MTGRRQIILGSPEPLTDDEDPQPYPPTSSPSAAVPPKRKHEQLSNSASNVTETAKPKDDVNVLAKPSTMRAESPQLHPTPCATTAALGKEARQASPISTSPPSSGPPKVEKAMATSSGKPLTAEEKRIQTLRATLAELTAERNTLLTSFKSLPAISSQLPMPSAVTGRAHPRHRATTANQNEKGEANAESDPLKEEEEEEEEEATNAAALGLAKAAIARHIQLLHAYNEIRDVGQGLMGLIADARGVRVKNVQEEFGIGGKD